MRAGVRRIAVTTRCRGARFPVGRRQERRRGRARQRREARASRRVEACAADHAKFDGSRSAAGGRNPCLTALVVSIATFMLVLDTSPADVAPRYIAGSLAAGADESTWVIISCLVANAVVLAASGWLASVIGRTRFYMLASICCASRCSRSPRSCAASRPSPGGAHLFPRAAGAGRRRHGAKRAGDPRRHVSAREAVAGVCWRCRGGGADDRSCAAWLGHRQLVLELDLLHQRPGRDCFAGAGAVAPDRARGARARAQGALCGQAQYRLDWLRASRALARLHGGRARQGPARGLVPNQTRSIPLRRCRCCPLSPLSPGN